MIIIIVEILMVMIMALGVGLIQPIQMKNGSTAVRFLVAQAQIQVVDRSQRQQDDLPYPQQSDRERLGNQLQRRQCQQRPYHQSNAEKMHKFLNLVLVSLN